MELIDWPYVARNALWLLGLSVAFAAWSHSSWRAAVHGQRLRQTLEQPLFVVPFAAGMLLLAASLAWGATRGWERLLWVSLGLWFAWELAVGVRRARGTGRRQV